MLQKKTDSNLINDNIDAEANLMPPENQIQEIQESQDPQETPKYTEEKNN